MGTVVYTVRKLGNLEPDYSTVVATESFKRGIHAWEVNFDRVGNTRVGLARWPGLSLDCGLHSKDLQGECWYVDYDGVVKHNRRGVVTELKQMLQVRVDAVCFVYTCRRLIDLSLLADKR